MPCRLRAPAQPLPSLWITDDTLADAFHRFARVSRAHRRYGSNVPGPLEARRRQSRRRMGLTTVTGGGAPTPPMGSWGAFMRLGGRPAETAEKERYRAPWRGVAPNGAEATWKWSVADTGRDAVQQDDLEAFQDMSVDVAKRSREAFEDRLQQTDEKTCLTSGGIEPLIDFLQGSSNDPEAKLTLRLVQWARDRDWTLQCRKSLFRVISQKTHLGTISQDEVVDIYMELFERSDARKLVPLLSKDLPIDCLSFVLPAVTRQIAESSDAKKGLIAKIERWLFMVKLIHKSFPARKNLADGSIWQEIYQTLAEHFRPSDLATHLGRLPVPQLAQVLLRTWAVPLAVEGFEEGMVNHGHFKRVITEHMRTWAVAPENAERAFESYNPEHENRNMPLLEIFSVLNKHQIPYNSLMREIFAIYEQTKPLNWVQYLYWDLHYPTWLAVPPDIGAFVVRHYLAHDQVRLASSIFLSLGTIPLLAVPDLPLRIIQQRRVSGEAIFQILLRQVPDDIVPFEDRVTDTSSLRPAHVDLVHAVALAWAASPHISTAESFRRAWECYRFLKDRRAPIRPAISMALVKTGITRPLDEDRRLSRVKVEYIISIAHAVEGPEVAAELDELVWEAWKRVRPQVSQSPIEKRRAEGGTLAWRNKGWAKDREQLVPAPEEPDGVRRERQSKLYARVGDKVEVAWLPRGQEGKLMKGVREFYRGIWVGERGQLPGVLEREKDHKDGAVYAREIRLDLGSKRGDSEMGAANAMADTASSPGIGSKMPERKADAGRQGEPQTKAAPKQTSQVNRAMADPWGDLLRILRK